jgi:hypothetical protein
MANKKETNKGLIQKPRLVLNNTAKFYLATHEVNSESDWFFFISLFYPVKNGRIMQQPQTEITTFDDAESAAIYYETLVHYCEFNSRVQYNEAEFPFTKIHIENFYKLTQQKAKENGR